MGKLKERYGGWALVTGASSGIGESLARNLAGRLKSLVKGRRIDESLWEDIEEILITSDVGVQASDELLEAARRAHKLGEVLEGDDVIPWMRKEMVARLSTEDAGLRSNPGGTTVVLIAIGIAVVAGARTPTDD